ncbi:MAG: hypothetical protein GX778_07035, partial [Erysipelothrix sp.]|nr:hypothetical protein [Erysipelothrix sp.]
VINDYSKIDSRYFYELLLNTYISSLNGKGLESLKLLELEIDDIYIDDSMLYVYRNDEYNLFTYFMILPLVLFLLVIGIISFDIIFKSILLSMIRELTIHLQSGAAKIDLQIRFITFYGILFIVSMFLDLVLLINLNIAYPLIILVATCINIILFVLCIFYINKSLNKQNIFDNLRGAYL